MMIDTLNLVSGDKVGVLYCINESNSLIQYEAVKALFEAEGIVVEAYTFSETTELQALVTSMVNNVKAVYVPSDNTVAANDTIVGTICTDAGIPVEVHTMESGALSDLKAEKESSVVTSILQEIDCSGSGSGSESSIAASSGVMTVTES